MSTAFAVSSYCDAEATETFECFGSVCAVVVSGTGPAGIPAEAAVRAKRRLLDWHAQFSRFEPDSELARLNRDPRETVPVSAMMGKFVEAALDAAAMTGGLVDPTLIDQLERAGYTGHFEPAPAPPGASLGVEPVRAPARPHPVASWRSVSVDRVGLTVTRPAGVRLDSGGIAKGLFGDILATVLRGHEAFAVNAAGDLRFGGRGELLRQIRVASPFDDSILHQFELRRGAVATSGISRRSWVQGDRQAHHLIDPATGRPAFTGIVQVTAVAPRGVDGEALAKAALLSGPAQAARWLAYGGVIVYDDGSFDVHDAASELVEEWTGP